MKENIIVSRLLDKYERSKHVLQPGVSARRVMLSTDKNDLPEYDYHDANTRDTFNSAAQALEQKGLVHLQWVKGRPVLSQVILNLDNVMQCYDMVGRVHPKELAGTVTRMVETKLSDVNTDWIRAWRDAVCKEAKDHCRVPAYCKNGLETLKDLLIAFQMYDALHGETITMRAFSSKCYHDTKYFEHHVREYFLRSALKYHTGLSEVNEGQELRLREQLAFLGIYARPELYELSGNCVIKMRAGDIHVAAALPYGLALPSTLVGDIAEIDLMRISTVTFIENKTNYDEYILSEAACDEMVLFHGGFMSPMKRSFFAKIAACVSVRTQVCFWGDIDLGGFQMFVQLKKIFPQVRPMRMSGEDVILHRHHGLKRSDEYLQRLCNASDANDYSVFEGAIQKIMEYKVTIEQETFLA